MNFSVSFFGFCILLVSFVPGKSRDDRDGEKILAIENTHLAHIKSRHSIFIVDDPADAQKRLERWGSLKPEALAHDHNNRKHFQSLNMHPNNDGVPNLDPEFGEIE